MFTLVWRDFIGPALIVSVVCRSFLMTELHDWLSRRAPHVKWDMEPVWPVWPVHGQLDSVREA